MWQHMLAKVINLTQNFYFVININILYLGKHSNAEKYAAVQNLFHIFVKDNRKFNGKSFGKNFYLIAR